MSFPSTWHCNIHDLDFGYDDKAKSLQKIENFFAECPACSFLKYNALHDELAKVRDQRDLLVDAFSVAQHLKATS